MPASNPFDILLEHDRWATRNILESCKTLTHDQFHQQFEMGLGSLHDTATHILDAMRAWEDVLAGREERPWLEGTERTPAELLVLHNEITDDFSALARKHPLDEILSRERKGKMYTYTRGIIITHVATHGMHHRAQCLNMLRHLGVNPLPESSVTEWSRAAAPKK
jgi:uncharacterized damage-inducible protein DinB